MTASNLAIAAGLPDLIIAAIATHRSAWDTFQAAPEGEASEYANDMMLEALDALLATSCATRQGAQALLDHLRWWLQEEVEFASAYQPAYGLAQTRASELTMFLDPIGADPSAPDPIYLAIEAADAAREAHCAALTGLDENDDTQMRRANTLCHEDHLAFVALARVIPTTAAGRRALAEFYLRVIADPDGHATMYLGHIAAALAGERR